MKILVTAVAYPTIKDPSLLGYIRTRNVYYQQNGIEVEVLNFSSKEIYYIDDIKVWSLGDFENHAKCDNYDLIICHAANLKNHYKFLIKHDREIKKIVFFYHGHEVLKINRVYSKPYPYLKRNIFLEKIQDLYDEFKFFMWRRYIKKHYYKCAFIFVSRWMKDEFIRWIKPNDNWIKNRSYITYNSVGEVFEKNSYEPSTHKEFDFITIRAMLDGSKYSVDIVNELAKRNPSMKFLLYGKGEYFNHYDKAPNLEWRSERLNHAQMIEILNSSRCALMPTRTDAQGVMMCEMATFGIPLITSDIPVCHEVFDGFECVRFINNELYTKENLKEILNSMFPRFTKEKRYFYSVVMENEMNLLIKIYNTK